MSVLFNKLNQYKVKGFKQIEPKIISDNFLTIDEIQKITNDLFRLKSLWKDRLNTENTVRGYYLPPSLYGQFYEEYLISVTEYKKLMYENFDWVYQKFILALEDYYKVKIEVLPELHYPGFHLYNLQGATEGVFGQPTFHQDVFYGTGKEILSTGMFLEKIMPEIGQTMTIVAPITVPASGAGLMYNTYRVSIIPSEIHDKVMNYIPGHLIAWSGNLYHSIKSFKLVGDETRITLQGHLNLLKDRGYLFW